MPTHKKYDIVSEDGMLIFKKKIKEAAGGVKRSFVGRHHFRANFYHAVSLVFLVTMILWFMGVISDQTSTIISMVLFTTDYLAEMYDPHPDNPGPWFKSHFHRFFDNEEC